MEGYVEDLSKWYHSNDCIISNSIHEGTQTSIVEGVATGCWAISSNWDGAEEIVDSKGLFSNFNDLEESYINSMANQLRDIHEVNINNLPNLPLRIDPLDGLLNNLPKNYKWKELRDYIKQLSIEKYIADSVLLHGDFWKGNLLWKSSNINGVVDWDYAAQGDPLSDLAVACLMIRYLNGQQDMDSFMAAYKQNSEIDEKRFLLWLINVASSTLYFINEWRFTTEDKNKMIDTATTIIFESYNQIKIIN